jgi:hypothetical protein
MHVAALAFAAVALLFGLASHRYQRTTLAIAKLQSDGKGTLQEISRLQLAMMPDWIGRVVLLERLSAAIAVVLLYFAYSWWGVLSFGVVYFLGLFAGIGGVFIPIMPYSWNLKSLERRLEQSHLKLVKGARQPLGATDDLLESMT